MAEHTLYQSPLSGRYAPKPLRVNFSDDNRYRTWRECWVALAEAQMELGVTRITPAMIAEMRAAVDAPIDYDAVKKKEDETRHDVMAHMYVFGLQCPTAKPIIHLSETSMYVVDNTDLILMRRAMGFIKAQVVTTVANLSRFSYDHRSLVTLGYTHFQPAQPTSVGKRATLYITDLLMDLERLEEAEAKIKARGVKGTTGTQESALALFGGDEGKVRALDLMVAQKLGFKDAYAVTGQTYSRKVDQIVAEAVAGIGSSAHKFGTDLRLLANLKILEEPVEKGQVGSSAMPYKRNPMHAERMCSLSRKLMNMPPGFAQTHATQWLERTLDDSAIRRSDVPEVFLLAGAVLQLYQNITGGMVVHPGRIAYHLRTELPFMATEDILIHLVGEGQDRQTMHERLRVHGLAAGNRVKDGDGVNDYFDRIASDPDIPVTREFLDDLVRNPAQFDGRATAQTEEYLNKVVEPVITKYHHLLGKVDSAINV